MALIATMTGNSSSFKEKALSALKDELEQRVNDRQMADYAAAPLPRKKEDETARRSFLKNIAIQRVPVGKSDAKARTPYEHLGSMVFTETMKDNFKQNGRSFGATEIEEYYVLAVDFLAGALHNRSRYTFLKYDDGRFSVDYKGEKRAIYTHDGRPLAFFRPNCLYSGYTSKQEELEAWKSGGVVVETVRLI